jgi:hypothetical protein
MLDRRNGAARRKERNSALDGALERRLAVYAAAAGAAGVGMLALASPARADIVYTPANIRIPQTTDGVGIKIDLNHDGINDFSMWIWSYADFGPTYVDLFLWAHNRANGAEGAGRSFAARLDSGATIGPAQKFAPAGAGFGGIPLVDMEVVYTGVGSRKSSFCSGPWVQKQKDGYLGVKFNISGQTHYGWIRLTTAACIGGGRLSARITGYAYNTEPDQPILAGQETDSADGAKVKSASGTLAQLALGSLGLHLWRREEPQTHDGN